MSSLNSRPIVIASLIAAALGALYAFGLMVFVFPLAPLVLCGLAVWLPRAAPDEAAGTNPTQRQRALSTVLALGGLCTLVFGVLTHGYLSWPNRQIFGVVLQVPALIGLIYQYQYGAFILHSKRLPTKVWPMRIIALTMGGMFGAIFIPVQVELAEHWFRDRQQPLLESLLAAEDKCATFKRYLAENPPDTPFQTPDLYSGAVENVYGGQPQFVLAFRAKADMESMIVYYYSGSRKWITTFRNNERGMQPLIDRVKPLKRCDGPERPIVHIPKD